MENFQKKPPNIISGQKMADFLRGAWLSSPPPFSLSATELEDITLPLLNMGGGGLAWWRIRHSPLKNSAPGREFRQAYRMHTIRATNYEECLPQGLAVLRAAGVEPILIKGWSVARLYPETGLRPYSDFDLCVAPDQLTTAQQVLATVPLEYTYIELHEGVPDVTDRTWPELYRRSRLVPLGESEVRVLGPEDQFRQLCLHLWRHHAFRVLWLCDIAVILDNLPADFDWDYCLAGDRIFQQWILAFAGLAAQLLGARIKQKEIVARAGRLSPWLTSAILWKWGTGIAKPSLRHYLGHPHELADAVRYKYCDPLRAAFRLKLAPTWPQWFIHVLSVLSRPALGLARLQKYLGKHLTNRPASLTYDIHFANSKRLV